MENYIYLKSQKGVGTLFSFLLNMCEITCLEAAPIINIEIAHNRSGLDVNLTHVPSIELCFYLHLPTTLLFRK